MSGFKFHVWPTEFRKITQPFGVNPQNYGQFGLPGHEGIDIRARTGSKIFCVAPGKVYAAYNKPTGHNYGIHVRVSHEDGYKTVYAHLKELFVKVGEEVDAGTTLGLADNTGNSYGPHLHLTLKKEGARFGRYPANIIDPTPFLLPLLGWKEPAGPYVGGWVMTTSVFQAGDLAQVNPDGATLRIGPNQSVLIPGGTIIIVAGNGRQGFLPIKVAKAAIGLVEENAPNSPDNEPPPTVTTVDGWAWRDYLHIFGNQAIIKTRYGINLRHDPDKDTTNLGVVRTASTVSVLGKMQDGYLPVRVRRADFIGPVNAPQKPPLIPIDSLQDLPEGIYFGWVKTQFLQLDGAYASTRHRGAQMLNRPEHDATYVGTIKGDATITIAGFEQNDYTPVLAHKEMLFNLAPAYPEIEFPERPPDSLPPVLPPSVPIHGTTPGWVFASEINQNGDYGVAGPHGLNLRAAPKRNAELIGFVPAMTQVLVMGRPYGEFSPVRIADPLLQPSLEDQEHDPDPSPVGKARLGLHASADPDITEAEFQEFMTLRPGIIKVLSFHNAADIAKLAAVHTDASWIVRAFLDFGDRRISASQFFDDTISDVQRALDQLKDNDVVVELHNEPNLRAEGMGNNWRNGVDFAEWWLELLERYRKELPAVRFIFPGLSPGGAIYGIKMDHIRFIEGSREAVEAADGLGIHLYWSTIYPMSRSLDVLDDYISRFRSMPIWITEASNNKSGPTPAQKARQYLEFWHTLQQRPIVQGVTFFVASASNPDFAEEVWMGRGISKIVGRR